ncbi:aminoacyl-histidine dipeptidase [Anaeromicropila populeti]|uniref:Cytosol non-specific dipeptidase n=1 Tax=Anaeromicropila populeti TaxID=37658 RepID=A0A1I6KY12_9FIRM|nr:aminoacyl-histidine dipeptidase [Anaeromicropila populeti]SFR96067.1 dipeptidase D [Anaeromicropila populeti]
MVLDQIDYKKVFYFFEQISNVPRGSQNNKGISDFLVGFAKEHNLEYKQDKEYNVVIKKPASKGQENCPAVMLQAHMDMVCEKNYDTKHDFTEEGLELEIEGDYIYANGTTLGGDDGIGMAYILTILDSQDVVHPKLEAVFTTDEEIGMEGAVALDVSDLEAKYMLNIDSDEEWKVIAGCAGGMRSNCCIPIEKKPAEGIKARIAITGLVGGHSGIEINKERVNGNILLGRLLFQLQKFVSFQVISIWGGLKDNAIPRESFAEIMVEQEQKVQIEDAVKMLAEVYGKEYKKNEPDLKITIQMEESSSACEIFSEHSFHLVLQMLLFTPNGVQGMSSDIEGLVESSLNLGIIVTKEDIVCFSYSVRSSVSLYKNYIGDKLKFLTETLGGTYSQKGEYPGWEYKSNSKLREICIKTYREMFAKEVGVEVVHAGLECGVILEKMPELDMISLGPNIYDIHTPNEKLSISSTVRIYDYVIAILNEICKVHMSDEK